MSDDFLINLLPSEYMPKPEFKGFPVFVILLLFLTAAVIWTNHTQQSTKIENSEAELQRMRDLVNRRTPMAMEAFHVQSRSRMMYSYAATIWVLLHQNPPWNDVYNEIEESLPEGMWIDTLNMVGSGERRWPSYIMVGMVAGNRPETVLLFYEHMLEPESMFEKVSISGYQFVKYKGHDAVSFNMRFSLKKSAFMGF